MDSQIPQPHLEEGTTYYPLRPADTHTPEPPRRPRTSPHVREAASLTRSLASRMRPATLLRWQGAAATIGESVKWKVTRCTYFDGFNPSRK